MAMTSGRKVLVGFAGLLVLGFVLLGAGYWWVNQQLAGVPGPGEPVTIEVPSGASAAGVGQQLADEGVIRNSLAFRLVARSRGLDAGIVAGTYELETGMSVDEAIAALGDGPTMPDTIRLTIPEGLTVTQTLARIADNSPFTAEELSSVLAAARVDRTGGPLTIPKWVPNFDSFPPDVEVFEGLLAPETYEFDQDVAAAAVLQRLIDQTEVAMATAPPSAIEAAEAAGVSRYDALVIASLVEREARVEGEWAEIAAVIRNRLADGMLLQIDATLLYAAGTPDGGPGAVDTTIDSPYNTYAGPGLPPTPISGARPEAIRAAFSPAATNFLYYVVAPECDGSHRFAETLAEHNANVQAFRDAGRCAGQ